MPALDRGLGAIPQGGKLLLRHDPAVEVLPFLLQAAAHHVREGRHVIVLVTARRPSRFIKAMEDLAGPVDGNRLHIVDAHSALLGEKEPVAYPVSRPTDLPLLASVLEQAVRQHEGAVVLIESLGSLLDHAGLEAFQAFLPRVLALAPRTCLLAAVFTAYPYDDDLNRVLSPFDSVVRLDSVEERVVLHQRFAIERTAWNATPPAPPVLYKVNHPGGVYAYIPKIVVLGPHGAGKTTFVQCVSDNALSVERMGTTVAMDRGTATLGGVRAEVFGTPGQERFDPLLPTLAAQSVAALLLVDATRPDTFPRAKDMLKKVWRRGLVVTIGLNKSDLTGAIGPDEARRRLATPPDVPILPCSATNPAMARDVLQAVINRVLVGGDQ